MKNFKKKVCHQVRGRVWARIKDRVGRQVRGRVWAHAGDQVNIQAWDQLEEDLNEEYK